jgi:hypothetical protein
MDTIGLQALFQDADFQAGLARYTAGLSRAESATSRTAGAMTAFGHTISTAIGTAIGYLATQAIPALERALATPLTALQAWGGQLDTLRDEFGMSGAEASKWAVAMGTYMGGVDEGASGLSAFVRNLNNMQDGLKTAGTQYGTTMRDIASAHADAMNKIAADWAQAQADAGENIATIWQDLASRRADIEENLADQIASIQDSLNERLADFARERAEVDKDTTKSLAKLDEDTKDRLRNARSAKERRQIRKETAERKKELLEQAAERKAEIDRQEAQAKAQAEKQIALAEKVAAKQIEAAEKAANKQVEAIEKALAKQQKAMQEASAAEEKQFAKQQAAAVATVGKAGESDPIAKALKQLGVNAFTAAGKIRPFAELMPEIMDAFKNLPPGINASAIAMQLFGRGGSKFLDFLRQGREGLTKATEEARAWGLILSDEDADATEEFGFELNRLKLQFSGLALTVGRAMLPFLSQMVSFIRTDVLPALTALAKEHMPAIQAALKQFGDWLKTDGIPALKQFADWIKANWPGIQATIETFWKVVKPVLEAFGAWLSSDGIQSLKTFFDKVSEFEPLVKEWAGWMGDLLDVSKSTTKKIDDDAEIKFPKLADIVKDSMDAIKRYFKDRMEFIKDFQKTTTALMEGNWNDFFDNLIRLFHDVWDTTLPGIMTNALTNIGKSIGQALIGPINTVIQQINQLIEQYKLFGGMQLPTLQVPSSTLGTAGGRQDLYGASTARVMAPVLTSPNYSRTVYNFSHTWNGPANSFDERSMERKVKDWTMQGIRQVIRNG